MPFKTPSTLLRNQACRRCRERKVKCDADRPSCRACRRSASAKGQDPNLVCCEYIEPLKRREGDPFDGPAPRLPPTKGKEVEREFDVSRKSSVSSRRSSKPGSSSSHDSIDSLDHSSSSHGGTRRSTVSHHQPFLTSIPDIPSVTGAFSLSSYCASTSFQNPAHLASNNDIGGFPSSWPFYYPPGNETINLADSASENGSDSVESGASPAIAKPPMTWPVGSTPLGWPGDSHGLSFATPSYLDPTALSPAFISQESRDFQVPTKPPEMVLDPAISLLPSGIADPSSSNHIHRTSESVLGAQQTPNSHSRTLSPSAQGSSPRSQPPSPSPEQLSSDQPIPSVYYDPYHLSMQRSYSAPNVLAHGIPMIHPPLPSSQYHGDIENRSHSLQTNAHHSPSNYSHPEVFHGHYQGVEDSKDLQSNIGFSDFVHPQHYNPPLLMATSHPSYIHTSIPHSQVPYYSQYPHV